MLGLYGCNILVIKIGASLIRIGKLGLLVIAIISSQIPERL
ncbi:hypothetical protein [Peribacillus frigoritolerans]|nr:hypothetical protein [Peribacillus frigoritolerans]